MSCIKFVAFYVLIKSALIGKIFELIKMHGKTTIKIASYKLKINAQGWGKKQDPRRTMIDDGVELFRED
jgi:hypothetical protein